MRKGNIGVAPEGLPFLFLLALTALAFAALRFCLHSKHLFFSTIRIRDKAALVPLT